MDAEKRTPEEEAALKEALADVINHYGLICQKNPDQGNGIMVYVDRDTIALSCMGEPKQEPGTVWHNFRRFDIAHAQVLADQLRNAIEMARVCVKADPLAKPAQGGQTMSEKVQGLFTPTAQTLLKFIRDMTDSEKDELVELLGPALSRYFARHPVSAKVRPPVRREDTSLAPDDEDA